jgi:hypothetical protein
VNPIITIIATCTHKVEEGDEKKKSIQFPEDFFMYASLPMMMMGILLIIVLKNSSITDRLILHVIQYNYIFKNDFCIILSINDSTPTTAAAATTTTTANTTNTDVVSRERKSLYIFF